MDVPPTVDAAVDKLTHQLGHRGHPAAVTYTGVLDAIVSPAPIEVLDAVPSCAPRHLQCREPLSPTDFILQSVCLGWSYPTL